MEYKKKPLKRNWKHIYTTQRNTVKSFQIASCQLTDEKLFIRVFNFLKRYNRTHPLKLALALSLQASITWLSLSLSTRWMLWNTLCKTHAFSVIYKKFKTKNQNKACSECQLNHTLEMLYYCRLDQLPGLKTILTGTTMQNTAERRWGGEGEMLAFAER